MVPPNLDLDFSTALESDDEEGDEEVNIVIDSPHRSSAPPQVSASGKDAKKLTEQNTASSSGTKGDEESSSTSNSSSFFVRNADLEAVATELGAKPTAVRLGGKIVKSLHFESRDRQRELLAEAGGSFSFPLMEKDLMASGLTNML